jgi:hypothetical protein
VRPVPFVACVLLVCLGPATRSVAEEGMWMPHQMPQLAPRLRALGYEGNPAVFADLTGDPMGAIVSLGGCSASFVSPEGLIATNHHCATGALQYNATPGRNLLKDGFLARSRSEEVWNGPGARATLTLAAVDVTADMERHVGAALRGRARFDAVEKWTKARTAACEKDGARCQIVSYFGGLQWLEMKQLVIHDLRLVYAPPSGIGNFGGETDNWRWPRHAGDFALFRAYVGKSGKPAPHAPDNVPYRPTHWLQVSAKGAEPGELVFTVGFPGRTQRYQTTAEIAQLAQWNLPRAIHRAEELIAILGEIARASPELAIKIESRQRSLNNRLTKNRGLLEALDRGGALAAKRESEQRLQAWIAADAARRLEYGAIIADVDALQAEAASTRERDAVWSDLVSGAGTALHAADTIYGMAMNRPKRDEDREPEYQERNWTRIREETQRAQRTMDPRIDRALLRYALLEASRLPAGQRIEPLDDRLGIGPVTTAAQAEASIDAFLDRLYAGTKLFDLDERLALLGKPTASLRASQDTFIELIVALQPFEDRLRDEREARTGDSYRLRPVLMKAILAENGGPLPPDANGSMRVSFGRVEGAAPRDGLRWEPQTTLAGILEKNTGEGEFAAPPALIDAIQELRAGKGSPFVDERLGDVPVDFLSTIDSTNGSSGSATIDARGELVGLLFDGTYDTVISDILYDPRTRSIHVDSRDMLFVLSEVAKAGGLVREMGVGIADRGGPPHGKAASPEARLLR